jgi:inward rectifier potassium channel
MQNPTFDPGLTQQVIAPLRRIINQDGKFNVRRRGTTWRDIHPYLHLVNMSWPGFLTTLFLGYVVINTLFAAGYFALGPDQLAGADAPTAMGRFLNGFFFSSHTLSTVGYGNISPKGMAANVVATFEALVGVLGFAVATGLLFGRVSRPSARIGFSENLLVSPYQDGTSLQFRLVNRRANSLMELEAKVMLMTVEPRAGKMQRNYQLLRLERPQVLFLPLSWTVVHPIDAESPLWGKTCEDLATLQAEVLILIKGYDDTFSQTVLSRHSYRHDEILWNRRFAPAFFVDDEGALVLELKKVGEVA